MATFTLETDYSCKTGYLFDNSRQIFENGCGFNFEWKIRLTLSVDFNGRFEDGLFISDSLCTDLPHPLPHNPTFPPHRKRGVCGVGGDFTQASLRRTAIV